MTRARAKKGTVTMELTEWEAARILDLRRCQALAQERYNEDSERGARLRALVAKVKRLGGP